MSVERTRARYGRQTRLPEIGDAGQARLGSARPELRTTGGAQTIEAAYLRAAGVTVPGDRAAPGEPSPASAASAATAEDIEAVVLREEALGLTDPAAREVARGALAALIAMREILGVTA